MQYINPEFFQSGSFLLFLTVLIIWSTVWKALAVWKAARMGSKAWFVVFFLINTAGILEMIYLFILNKPEKTEVVKTQG